jgi:predicted MPP superfamily phosphohydrolase
MWKGLGAKPAIIWAAISVSVITWWVTVPRIFVINTPPALAIIGYMYLPFTVFSFMLFLIADTIGIVIWCLLRIKIKPKYKILVVFILTSVMFCHGYFEAKDIRVVEIFIQTEKLPSDTDSIRIVQISDLHIGKIFCPKQLIKTMEIVGAVSPDLIVLTGDIVDIDLREDEYLAKILGGVAVTLGKFAVTGNHEHYAGLDQAVGFMSRAGYRVLRSDWYDLGPLVIAGVDDPGRSVVSKENEGYSLLSSLPAEMRNKFILFLKHQPHVHEDTTGLFDLQLSGHTHGGQIWPLGYLVSFLHGISQGLSVNENSFLYVSNGTGYWGPPIRFFTPPEVTIINVARK